MRISAETPDAAVLAELGRRLAQSRIHRDLTQRELATEAGVGLATVARLEAGNAVGVDKLIRVLRVLGLLDALDQLVTEPRPSPLELLERERVGRRRVRHRRARVDDGEGPAPWRWHDDAPGSVAPPSGADPRRDADRS